MDGMKNHHYLVVVVFFLLKKINENVCLVFLAASLRDDRVNKLNMFYE